MKAKNISRKLTLFAVLSTVVLPGCSPFVGRNTAVTPTIWPVDKNNAVVSSGYGDRVHPVLGQRRKHNGIDIAVPQGTPVYATAAGAVIFTGYEDGFGNYVKIDHGDGLYTYYAHLSKRSVKAGDQVKKGDLIAYSGKTGMATGYHLHYELRLRGKSVNPKWALP